MEELARRFMVGSRKAHLVTRSANGVWRLYSLCGRLTVFEANPHDYLHTDSLLVCLRCQQIAVRLGFVPPGA